METQAASPADAGNEQRVAGCVESFADGLVSGWAFDSSGERLRLELKLGDTHVSLPHQSMPRGDVAAVFGEAAAQAGFRALLSDADRERLREAFTLAIDVAVIANGVRLTTALRDAPAIPAPTTPSEASAAPGIRGHVDTCECFRVLGWAVEEARAGSIELHCNGSVLPAPVVRESRPDVVGEDGRRIADAGFVLDLPATLWQEMGDASDCLLEIRCGGNVLSGARISLDNSTLVRWIAQVLELPDTPERAPLALLALEHVQASGIAAELAAREPLWAALVAAARKLGVEPGMLRSRPSAAGVSESLDNLLLWDTMRTLNARLAERPAGAADAIVDVFRNAALTPAAREWYANLAIQVACDTGELDRVREITDFSRFAAMASSEDASALCLAIAVLARDGQITQATDALARLAALRGGWLQTTCLRHAIRDVIAAEQQGHTGSLAAEQFRLAFLALLDALGGDWFARLFDQALIDGMADIVSACSQYSDAHIDEVQVSAVRHYGLCPAFWDALVARGPLPASGPLAEAFPRWRACRDALDRFPSAAPAAEALAALQWFSAAGNGDALTAVREMAANLANHGLDAAATAARLLADSPADALRLHALPVPPPASGMQQPLIDLARLQAGCHVSEVGRLQREAVAGLLALQDSALRGEALEAAARDRLERLAALLGDARAMNLGCDLLATLTAMPAITGAARSRLLAKLRTQLLTAIGEVDAGKPVPAPVFAALARLQAQAGDRLASAVLNESLNAIREAHPAWLVEEPAALSTPARARWLADTLVIVTITSAVDADCIPRIRASWASDLADVGIRTLYARHDLGEGALHADDEFIVRARATASGNAADLPGLLRQASARVAASYFIVLPASACLSVARLVETAAYRKHHAHGSLLKRSDITSRLTALTGEEPGPFTPARLDATATVIDAEIGFSVSAAALRQALAKADTWQGRRLVARARDEGELLSDLLALAGVVPSDEDFHCHFRLAAPGRHPVAHRQNAFLPGPDTPTFLTNAGDDEDYAQLLAAASNGGLRPHKIWPSTRAPRLGRNTNQLELLTPVSTLQRLQQADVTVVAVMRNEMLLLPHFLAHYRRLGAGAFVVVDNLSDDGSREYLLSQPDVIVYSADTEYRHSHYGVTWQHTVLANHCLGKWVLLADADEFLVYENSESVSLPAYTRALHAGGADATLVRMIDMYPFGDLGQADFTQEGPFDAAPWFDREPLIELMFGGGQFSNSRNFVNGLRHRIAPSRINAYVSQKYALFRYMPWMRLSEGVHYTANMRVAATPAFFAHFKYHAGFKAKVFTEVKRKQHYNGAEEYKRYAAMLAEGSGAFGVEGLSVRYAGSADFMAVAATSDRALLQPGDK